MAWMSGVWAWVTDHATVLSAVISAIAAGLVACFTIVLARVGRQQISDTKILQRAYLSVVPGGIRPFAGMNEDRIACDIIICNAGNLPARKVSWFIDKKYSEDAYEADFQLGESSLVGDIVIAPRGEVRKGASPTNKKVFAERVGTAQPYRAWLYVWGRVAYHDGFRGGRFIDFCHRYNLHGASAFEIPAVNGRHHESGNKTDEG
jgi:hypothetical protein